MEEARRFVAWLAKHHGEHARRGVADLACGAGRHAWTMARELGWDVTGLDLSPDLLRKARLDPATPGTPPHPDRHPDFVRGDLRRLPFRDGAFGMAVNLFTSFGYFASDEEHERTLGEMSRILRTNGLLVLDVLNAEPAVAGLVPRDERNVDNMHVIQNRRYSTLDRRIVKVIDITFEDGSTRRVTESVRVFRPLELDAMLRNAGLETLDRRGGYDGSAYDEKRSPRMITLAVKAS